MMTAPKMRLQHDIERLGITYFELKDFVDTSCKQLAETVNAEGPIGQFKHLASHGWSQQALLERALFRKLMPTMQIEITRYGGLVNPDPVLTVNVISTDKEGGTVAVRGDDGQCFNIYWTQILRIISDEVKRISDRFADSIIKDQSDSYDALEIHGVREYTDPNDIEARICEVDDEEPQLFSVYVHLKSGGVECVGDFTWFGDALEYAVALRMQHGYPINNYVRHFGIVYGRRQRYRDVGMGLYRLLPVKPVLDCLRGDAACLWPAFNAVGFYRQQFVRYVPLVIVDKSES